MNEKNRTHLLRSCAVTALLNQLSFESRRAGTPPQTKQLSPGSRLSVSCRTGAVKMIVPGASCRRVRGQAELEKRCPRHNPIDHPRTQSIRPQIKCDRVVQVVDHSIDLNPRRCCCLQRVFGALFFRRTRESDPEPGRSASQPGRCRHRPGSALPPVQRGE